MGTSALADPSLLIRFALAFGLGMLIGLQREWSSTRMAGIRTFPIVALVGAVAASLVESAGGWTLAAGLLAMTAVTVLGNWLKLKQGSAAPGLTTEVTMLLAYLLGAIVVLGDPVHAVVLTGAVAVLLQLKGPLHAAVGRLGDHDVKAITQFVLISLVILPLLPSRDFGPYSVLNPREIWWMVVLIVGIGLAGYLAYKFFGEKAGTLLGGLLGGLVSSTATSVSYARRSREQPALSGMAAVVVILASTVVFARVLIEIGAVASSKFRELAPPVAIYGVVLLLIALVAWRRERPEKEDDTPDLDLGNPSELRSALVFGLLYAGVLLAVAWAKDQLGSSGLYAVAVISGLTDMDAITLSTARLAADGQLSTETAWRAIVIASMSNLVFKGGAVAVLGAPALRRKIAVLFGLALVAGGVILVVWPG